MPLESATYVDDLVSTNPLGTDDASLGDDHIRLIKSVLKNTFPNLDGALTTKLAALNGVSQLITVGSDGKTLTFNFPSGGTVGNVTDWTSNQPVPASQADGRYLLLSKSNQIVTNLVTFTGATGFNLKISNAPAAPTTGTGGDVPNTWWVDTYYARSTALNTETTNRTNADTNLQNQINNRVQKTGDTINWLNCNGEITVRGSNPNTNNGDWNYSPGISFGYDGRATVDLFVQEQVGDHTDVVIRSLFGGNALQYWWFNQSGDINSRSKGTVAFQSDLPFIDKNLRVQVWVVDSCKDGDNITIPTAFSSTLGVTAQDMTPYSRHSSIEPVKINTDLMSGSQFSVQIWSGSSDRRVLFVAYGYL